MLAQVPALRRENLRSDVRRLPERWMLNRWWWSDGCGITKIREVDRARALQRHPRICGPWATVTLGHVDSLLRCSSGGQKEASALCRSASVPAARRGGQRSISKILTLLMKWTTIYERMRFAQQDMERTMARHQNDIGVL
jgi:hypothetical protein